ncbi:MAG: tRNA (adenosine(37)-N6)-threonylcarbamoyltransferase complex ATPase subunit type 1 TsaE [Candidatus Binatia bacterium]
MPVRETETSSPEETEGLAERLGRAAEGGEVVGLEGELGAGKTCFVRGLARGLGVDPDLVASPTFVIATEYRGGRLPLHHVDLYRLEPPLVDTLFLREVLYGAGVTAVEWFDRLLPATGDDVLHVILRHGDGSRRAIRLAAHGSRHEAWLARALGT